MLITSIEELRLAAPAHAIDNFDSITGIIDNVEHDVLEEKLGTPLYQRLCQWYDENRPTIASVTTPDIGYFNHLWLLSMRVVAYSSLSRIAGQQAVSLNGAGINQFTATDYPTAQKDNIELYRQSNQQEAAAAVNHLLRQLESWMKQSHHPSSPASTASPADTTTESPALSGSPADDAESPVDSGTAAGDTIADTDLQTICALWRQSHYYYLASRLLIPSATVLYQYISFPESREKFILMLTDLRWIQEEMIAPAIGEDFLEVLLDVAEASVSDGTPVTSHSPVLQVVIHRLRKAMAALLVGRTSVLKPTKEQKIQFHDDGVRMLDVACTYIRNHQSDIIAALEADAVAALPSDATDEDKTAAREAARAPFERSPLYAAPLESSPSAASRPVCCDSAATPSPSSVFTKGDPAAWTPPLF